jgi:hypothetical protein
LQFLSADAWCEFPRFEPKRDLDGRNVVKGPWHLGARKKTGTVVR